MTNNQPIYLSFLPKSTNFVGENEKLMKSKEYKEPKESVDMVCEPSAITYGMSNGLVNSGTEEMKVESSEEVEWDLEDTSNLEPYTLEELHARIAESHQQYLRGEYKTELEVREELKREFPWLQ